MIPVRVFESEAQPFELTKDSTFSRGYQQRKTVVIIFTFYLQFILYNLFKYSNRDNGISLKISSLNIVFNCRCILDILLKCSASKHDACMLVC